MNSSTQQVNEDYKFKMAYIFSLLKDMFSTSKEMEETDVDNKVKEIIDNQDSLYIENLEKELNNHNYSVKKGSKVKKAEFNSKNVKTKVQNSKKKNKNNDIVLEEEYEK